MGIVKALGILSVALVAVGWSYFSHIAVPSSVGEPWKYRLVIGVNKAIVLMAHYYDDFEIIQNSHASIQYFLSSRGTDQIRITNEEFGGVSVRLYLPKETGFPRPGVVFYHGGGYNMFTPYGYDGLCMRLARDLGAVVVSVGYRLAPQHVVPSAFEDCKTATLFFFENSEVWDVYDDHIGAVGEGNGAALALAVSLLLRDAGSSPQFSFLGLLSPAVQVLDFSLPSYVHHTHYEYDFSHIDAVILSMTQYLNHSHLANQTRSNSHVSAALYHEYRNHVHRGLLGESTTNYYCLLDNFRKEPLSEKFEFDLSDPYNMPLMADTFEDLPPTFVMTSEADGMRDEGVILAHRMTSQGQVTHAQSVQGWHGMFLFVDPPLEVQEAGDMVDRLTEFASAYV